MPHLTALEWFGYAASVIVAVSLTMSSIVRLRWYNLVGAAAFSTYGFLIHAYPVGVLNGFIALADVYYLIQMYRRREHFQAIALDEASPYLAAVLEAHREEIARLFPGFQAGASGRLGLCVLRDLAPASFLLGTPAEDGTLDIDLDYALPPYRDLRPGGFLFQEARHRFQERGLRLLRARTADHAHGDYLRKVGFQETEPQTFLLELT